MQEANWESSIKSLPVNIIVRTHAHDEHQDHNPRVADMTKPMSTCSEQRNVPTKARLRSAAVAERSSYCASTICARPAIAMHVHFTERRSYLHPVLYPPALRLALLHPSSSLARRYLRWACSDLGLHNNGALRALRTG